ncbi:Sulfite exporter TauE/SafE [compost metagenome]
MTPLILLGLLFAGVMAGGLTTVAGLGGGILMIAGLSLFWAPATVIAVTAPALFFGNVSRVALLRREVDWSLVGRFALTAGPTALVASYLAVKAPAAWLKVAIAVLLLAFVGQELLKRRPAEGEARVEGHGRTLLAATAGAVSGTVSGLTGGAGFIATPFFLRLGLGPKPLVATSAACMALVHLLKGVGFSLNMSLTPALLPAALVLTVGVLAGNSLGSRLLERLSERRFRQILLGVLTVAALQLLITA